MSERQNACVAEIQRVTNRDLLENEYTRSLRMIVEIGGLKSENAALRKRVAELEEQVQRTMTNPTDMRGSPHE
jgi:polyhydroxyalkanoate synthesis regulator phasin